ncbi:MAG TPA: tetratricopeptide repeat protein, partial [Saprospiraceae bacterium]
MNRHTSWSFDMPFATQINTPDTLMPILHRLKCVYSLILLLLGTSMMAIGQSSDKIDSLQHVVLQSKPDPAQKADLNQQLGIAYRQAQILDSALYYLKQSIDLFTSLGDSRGILKCNNSIAEIYLMQGNNPLASEILSRNIPIATALQDKESLAQTYNNLGRTYNQLGDFDAGLKHYEEALRWSNAAGLDRLTASTYYGMGMNYYGRGDFPKALTQYENALDLYKQLENKNAIAVTLSAMGNIYYDQGLYTKALQHHIDALTTNKELNNNFGVASNYSNIANVYFIQDNFTKALEFQTESLHMHEKIGNKTGMATNYYNLALIYDRLHQHQEALTAQLSSLAIHEEIQDKAGAIFCHKHLGDLYTSRSMFPEAIKSYEQAISFSKEVGDKVNLARILISLGTLQIKIHQLTQSRKNIEQGLLMSRQQGIKDAIRDAYYQLMKLDSISGHYLDALANYKLYTLYKDSLLTESNHQLTRELQTRYETEKKDQEIALLNKESIIQKLEINKQRELKQILIGTFLLAAFLSLLIYHFYITKQKLKLLLLRNKIASDLHDDVGSTLSSISIFSQMAKQQSRDVNPLLDSIGESSRKMLDAMADIVWTINPENDQFEKIILRMRSFAYELLGAKNIEFEFNAEDDISRLKLPMEVRKNLYLIFKEATNNLAKYADANKATFAIKEDKNILSMMIRDNGKGFDPTRSTEGNGIRNMKKRAEEIGGRLSIDSAPGNGTTIQLSVA